MAFLAQGVLRKKHRNTDKVGIKKANNYNTENGPPKEKNQLMPRIVNRLCYQPW